MTWETRFRRRENTLQSLWLVPLLGALAGFLLALVAVRLGTDVQLPAYLTTSPSTASSVLSAILGAMIGLVGFVVTVTVLLVQTSTSQFSARYMRLLYRDQLLKLVLAVLVGTFAYSFVLLRRVGSSEAPDLGLLLVGGFVLAGIVLFLLFLSRNLQRLRPAAVAAAVSELGREAFLELTQSTAASPADEPPSAPFETITSTRSGTIQAIHIGGLVDWARHHACTVVFRHGVGDFVHPGLPLCEVWGSAPPSDTRRDLEGMVALGKERTIEQDPAFAIRVLVDIANRALSPAVNDPTTAVQILDYIENLLLLIGRNEFSGRGVFRDPAGTPRLVLPSRDWEDYLALALTEIRQYGGGSIQVVRRLRALLLRLQEGVLPAHRSAVADELTRLDTTVHANFGGHVDLDRSQVPDAQGLGGPPGRRA
jgi:uncharacterized membrane protein